jgi:ribokinase
VGAVTRDFYIAADGTFSFPAGGTGVLGGGGSYAMAGAHLWSSSIGLVGRYTKTYPADWVAQMASAGVDLSGLHQVDHVPAELVFGRYFSDGEREVYDPVAVMRERGLEPTAEMIAWNELGGDGQRNVIRELSPNIEDIPKEYMNARALHLAPMPYRPHRDLVEALRPFPLILTLDPGPHYMSQVNKEELRALLTNIQVFLPSEGEVISFFGAGADMADCAKRLAEFGAEIVGIKRSTRGSLVYERTSDKLYHIPIFPTQMVDATGAGDSYCGGFMVGYTETGSARQAGLYGAVSASFIVESPGALYGLGFAPEEAHKRLHVLEQTVS